MIHQFLLKGVVKFSALDRIFPELLEKVIAIELSLLLVASVLPIRPHIPPVVVEQTHVLQWII